MTDYVFGGGLISGGWPLYGPNQIVETVTRQNAPARRLVRLHHQSSSRYQAVAWSDATTGEIRFKRLAAGPWYLVAFDHTLEFEAVAISDRLATLDGERP